MSGASIVERLKRVQLRGNTQPSDLLLLAETVACIRDLEAEVKRLKVAIQLHVFSQHILEERAEAAESKLAAIEGLARYKMTAPEYGLVEAYDSENGVCADKPDECDWIKAADIRAILDPEAP